jgi:hypothetical protein
VVVTIMSREGAALSVDACIGLPPVTCRARRVERLAN